MVLTKRFKKAQIRQYRLTWEYSNEPSKIYYVDFKRKTLVCSDTIDVPYEQSYAKVWVDHWERYKGKLR